MHVNNVQVRIETSVHAGANPTLASWTVVLSVANLVIEQSRNSIMGGLSVPMHSSPCHPSAAAWRSLVLPCNLPCFSLFLYFASYCSGMCLRQESIPEPPRATWTTTKQTTCMCSYAYLGQSPFSGRCSSLIAHNYMSSLVRNAYVYYWNASCEIIHSDLRSGGKGFV